MWTVAAALDAAGCERISVKSSDKPVAVVWHVFRPQDADRIRSFVDKVSVSYCLVNRGEGLGWLSPPNQ